MDLGLYSFAETNPDSNGVSTAQRLRDLIEEIELADQLGLEVFGVGEHHRRDYAVSSAAAERTIGVAFTMLGAMLLVHLSRGFFMPTGIEFTLALLGSTVLLALAGAGAYSLDMLIARRRGPIATVSSGERPGTRRAA